MTERHDYHIKLTWTEGCYVYEYGEPEDYIYTTSGELIRANDDSEALAGKFTLHYVDVDRAMDEKMSIFDVFDAYSHTFEYHDALFGANSPDFSDRLTKTLKHEAFGGNVLILDRLEILPEYRGRGLGLSVMRRLIKRFSGGAAIVVMKPYPLQFESETRDQAKEAWRSELGLAELGRNQRAATKKLFDYYGRLDFVRISGTPFMVRSTMWSLP